jgi:hypothetical protein
VTFTVCLSEEIIKNKKVASNMVIENTMEPDLVKSLKGKGKVSDMDGIYI